MMRKKNKDFLYYDNKVDEELFDDILLNSSFLYDSDVDDYVYEYDNVEDFDEQKEDENDKVFDDVWGK